MTCSLIITTYNWKEALELVLLSALNQSELPDEIIIADDGSNEDTKKLVDIFIQNSKIPIIYSWQEDDGFQAAKSRNKAISKAKGNYIIIIDGDIILHKDFISDHFSFAKEGYFIQGIRAKLSDKKADEIFRTKEFKFKPFEDGIKNKRNSIRSNILSFIFSGKRYFRKLDMLQTSNMAFFKDDCIKINGFNEDFVGWGREDGAFGARLFHNGVKRRDLRFKAIGYHIWHNENTRESLKANDKILETSIKNKSRWCENGIG